VVGKLAKNRFHENLRCGARRLFAAGAMYLPDRQTADNVRDDLGMDPPWPVEVKPEAGSISAGGELQAFQDAAKAVEDPLRGKAARFSLELEKVRPQRGQDGIGQVGNIETVREFAGSNSRLQHSANAHVQPKVRVRNVIINFYDAETLNLAQERDVCISEVDEGFEEAVELFENRSPFRRLLPHLRQDLFLEGSQLAIHHGKAKLPFVGKTAIERPLANPGRQSNVSHRHVRDAPFEEQGFGRVQNKGPVRHGVASFLACRAAHFRNAAQRDAISHGLTRRRRLIKGSQRLTTGL